MLILPKPVLHVSRSIKFHVSPCCSQVYLLEYVIDAQNIEEQDLWLQEILAVLDPCAEHCQEVAGYLASFLRSLCQLVCTCREPLCLSLGLCAALLKPSLSLVFTWK